MALQRSTSQAAKNSGSQFACQLLEEGRPRYIVVRFKHKSIEAYDIASKATIFSFLLEETQLDLEAGPRPGTTGLCVVHKLSSESRHLVGPSKSVSGMLEAFVSTKDTPSEEQRIPSFRYRNNQPTPSIGDRSTSLTDSFSPSVHLSKPQTRDAASSPMAPLVTDLHDASDDSVPTVELVAQGSEQAISCDYRTLENEMSKLSSELEQLKTERDDLRSIESGLVRENETIKRQLKELAITTEELEERLKQPPPSLPTTHDDDGVDQILLQMQRVLNEKSQVLADKSQLQRYVVDLEERVNFLENQHDVLLAGFNEELQALEAQKAAELA
eukprot:CAMPEP_0118924590 /NCGR_PEP_ID=MMETSP1169-20130426/2657_1 /TAXON_ID=36882 /ORGANISM="Pyramimonas obovata, Strain CCMP722" /LENGTH=328 /DNA_ID=CAMNT_0006865717 /DNA_START=315 /DNA_END=1298 /DNA_ORIENTATION=-